jgi:diguanylate cyclase (GGDEF)-like protein
MNSIRAQFNALLIILVLIIGTGSALFFNYQQQQLLKTNLQNQADSISALISQDLAKLIYLNDTSFASEIIQQIEQIPALLSAQIVNSQNTPILTIDRLKEEPPKGSLAVNSSLQYKGIDLGRVSFIFYSEELALQIYNSRLQFIAIMFLMVLFSLFLGIYFDKKFLQRLSHLNQALKDTTSSKQFNIRLKANLNDEIGQAQQNFNTLVAMVEKQTATLRYQADHDSLTGLYSRNYLLSKIDEILLKPAQPCHALCYIDLDQFKVVNDTCGHQAGDQLLIQLTQELKEYLQTIYFSTLGRIGGDEFILLLKNRDKAKINLIVEKIHSIIKNLNFIYFERSFPIESSIGVIYFQNSLVPASELLSAADAACYEAKNKGRNTIVSLDIKEQAQSSHQQDMNLISTIYTAIEQDLFKLYFQPIVNIDYDKSEKYNHFETLLRLPDPRNPEKLISPALFIPIAERYGLAFKIDLWVIENLFKILNTNLTYLTELDVISINLSIDTLVAKTSIVEIEALFTQYKIPTNKICFEITETGFASSVENIIDFINHFKQQKVRFSLDDFGSGMSSFGYLSQLDVDYLKIDGSFVQYLEDNPINQEMVFAMCRIGKSLNKKIIAEYVETEETIQLLEGMQVDYLQGYFFSQPRPIDEFFQTAPPIAML